MRFFLPNPGSNPSEHNLLTPPLTPPPQNVLCLVPNPPPKCSIQFQGDRGLKRKIHWGIVLSGKTMILQEVGHPISCLGVCYANDPQKEGGGGMASAPTPDLTTSLRGDFWG